MNLFCVYNERLPQAAKKQNVDTKAEVNIQEVYPNANQSQTALLVVGTA